MKLSGKGKSLLVVFFCLPFGQISGLALPFGLFIAFLGFRMAFSRNSIWLPSFLKRKKINGKILENCIHQVLFFVKKIKCWTYPRFLFFGKGATIKMINGSLIGIIGICLAISMPIPLSSLLASVAIFLLGFGMLNDDGILVLMSYPLALSYILFVIFTLKYISIDSIFNWIGKLI